MIQSYYIKTDEGLELIHVSDDQPITFIPYATKGEGYRLTYSDGSGFDVYDYTPFDGSTQDFQLFLNRNLDR